MKISIKKFVNIKKKIGEKNLDNYFILDKNNYNEMGIGAFLQEKKSGRILKIFTTQPGLNIFSDNYGISIEPMHFPDSPNIGFFPSTILEPGKVAGAIITDVTKTQMNREKIARRANEVISKNISIVQEIACLLGEHMVETETLLSSIADDYDK